MKLPQVKGSHKIRDAKIVSMYSKEYTEEHIGEKFDLTPRRIRQIVYENRHFLKIDQDWEKYKSVKWLERQIKRKETMGIPSLKDTADLVKMKHDIMKVDKGVVVDQSKHQHITVVWEIDGEDQIQTPQESRTRMAGSIEV